MSTAKSGIATRESAVSIPRCTAKHVLGSTIIPLAIGNLTLLTTPTLTLQIDARAFLLPLGTPFGADAKNQRAYVFAPAGLDSQGGYVRIELPPDVSVEMHTEFERTLVTAGLLMEGDTEHKRSARGAGSWIGQKIQGFKGAVTGGFGAEGGGVPAEVFESSGDEGR